MTAPAPGSLWYYAPNKGAPIAFALLFLISAIVHAWQCWKHKSVRLTFLIPFGNAVLAAGYATRAVGAWEYGNLPVFIASTVLLVMGPPFFAGAMYFILARTLYYVPWLSPLHPGRVLATFLGLDVLCELIFGTGAARAANFNLSNAEHEAGIRLVQAGLILLCVMFIFYLAIAAVFHIRCERHRVGAKIRSITVVVYVIGLLILERSAFRAAEQFEGYTGTIYKTEALFWVFEASAMLIVTTVLHLWHPGRVLPVSDKTYLATDGITEREGPGWGDKRPFYLALFDPFDVASLCTRRRKNVRFWEEVDRPEKERGDQTAV